MSTFVEDLIEIGALVVFAYSKPVFKLSRTQCVKDWFPLVRLECLVFINEVTVKKSVIWN